MAKNENNRETKTRADKKREQYVLIGGLIVMASMILSGAYYLFDSNMEQQDQAPTQTNNDFLFNGYAISSIGNSSLMVTAGDPLNELVAMVPSQCVDAMSVGWVQNITMAGMKSEVFDVANPARPQGYIGICGDFLFFRFSFDSVSETTVQDLDAQLSKRLNQYVIKRSYIGLLPGNLSGPGTDRFLVIGSADIKKGDKATILLFQKQNDMSVFAVEKKVLPVGPTVPATVLSVENLTAQGTIVSDSSPDKIQKALNATDMRVTSPKITVDAILDNQTLKNISALTGVSAQVSGNKTVIDCNRSLSDVIGILDSMNGTYSKANGSIMLKMPLKTDLASAKKVMESNGVKDPVFKNTGKVSTASEILLNGNVVPIQDYKSLSAVLDTTAKTGDKINVTLSILQFGEQAMVLGATQQD